MSKFRIEIKSEAHSKAVQDKLFELGKKWSSSGSIQRYEYTKAPKLFFKTDRSLITYSSDPTYGKGIQQITLDDLYEMCENKVVVRLNDSYDAEVTAEGVVVGCQTFKHGVILELAEKVDQFMKKQ
jgi:hypothetical protein